jgi:TPR repeat protein
VSDPSAAVRRAAIRALAMYANWRYPAAQQALIALATDPAASPMDRLNAADAIGYAVRLQVKGVRQDPPMFHALVSLLKDKEEPIRSTAAGILMPIYQPGAEAGQRRRAPEGGWEKWLDEITAEERGARKSYEVCASRSPGSGSQEPVDLFCMGDAALLARHGAPNPAKAFQYTLAAAEKGYVPAQAAVALMYANGKGVQQNYEDAGKWWIKAAEGGDLVAARHAWNLYRNGEGVPRDPAIANRWAQVIGEPVQTPRNRAPAAGAANPVSRQ